MKKTGKKKKRQVKKILTVLVVILVVGIAGVVGAGIWKNRGISKEEQVASTAKKLLLQGRLPMKEKNIAIMSI
ncbi:MAG: hypothetical protein ACLS20_07745 [Faecalimonas umbilicata]